MSSTAPRPSVTAVIIEWGDEAQLVASALGDACESLVIIHPPKAVHQLNETLLATQSRYALVLDGAALAGDYVELLAQAFNTGEHPPQRAVVSPALDGRAWWEPVNPCCYMLAIDLVLAKIGKLNEKVDSQYHARLLTCQLANRHVTFDVESRFTALTVTNELRATRQGDAYYEGINDMNVVVALEEHRAV